MVSVFIVSSDRLIVIVSSRNNLCVICRCSVVVVLVLVDLCGVGEGMVVRIVVV